MTTPRRQHFVPKGYLRAFASPKGSEMVCVINVPDRRVFTTNMENVCVEKDYYAATLKDGSKTTELESHLAKLDGVFADIVRKIADGEELSASDRYDFSTFVATQHLRTPEMKEFASKAIGSFADHLAKVTASDPKHFHATWDAMVKATGFETDEDPEEIRQLMLSGEIKGEGTHAASVALGLAPLPDVAEICFRMKWTFFHTRIGNQFLTCDNPVGFFHPWLLTPGSPPPGLIHKDTNLHLPISPSVYAIGGQKMKHGYAELPKDKIREVNQFTVLRAERQIVLPYEDPALIRFAGKILDRKSQLQTETAPPVEGDEEWGGECF